MPSKFDRFPTVAAVLVIAVVVAACVIKLRDGEGQPQSNTSAGAQPDPLGGKLERCRSVTYERRDELGECQKIWAEKRRQFLLQGNETAVRKDQSDAAGPLTAPVDNVGRVQSGRPKSARE